METSVSAIANIDVKNKRLFPIRLTIGILLTLSDLNEALFGFIWGDKFGRDVKVDPFSGFVVNFFGASILAIPSMVATLATSNHNYMAIPLIIPLITALNSLLPITRALTVKVKSNMPED